MRSSAVIVSYEPGDWLEDSISSALSQTSDVIVVDNGSADRRASEVASHLGAAPVRSETNLGFAGGVALGLRHIKGDLVGILNDDAVAGEGWITSAQEALANPDVAAVTPKVILDRTFGEIVLDDEPWFAPGDPRPLGRQLKSVTVDGRDVLDELLGPGVYGTEKANDERWRWTSGQRPFYVPFTGLEQVRREKPHPPRTETPLVELNGESVNTRAVCNLVNHAGSFLDPYGLAGEFGFAAPDDGRFDESAERFGFSATAPVFRTETLHRLGAFAEEFFAYNEDTDWCLRARLSGMRVLYEPSATVAHRLSATSGGVRDAFVRFLAERNAILCLLRNAPSAVARRALLRDVPGEAGRKVKRAVVAKLPWALSSRFRMRRAWVSTPQQVWDRWAGTDSTWDVAPCRTGGLGISHHPEGGR